MANGFFGFGAMGAMPDQASQQDPAERRSMIEAAAAKHQVPANVLMALDEAGVSDFNTAAQKISADMKGGKSVDQVVGPDLMNRAYDIADKIYPRQQAPAPQDPTGRPKEANALRDVPAAVGSSLANAVGGTVRGLGEGLSAATDAINNNILDPFTEGFTGKRVKESASANIAEPVAQAIGGNDGLAGYLDSFVSSDVKQEMADLTDPNADLFDRSTWKMGKKPTVRGAVYSAIDVFGSMAPMVAVGIITKSPTAAAAAGAGMSAGDASQNAAQVIDEMAQTKLADGRTKLEAESSVYKRLIDQGIAPEEAVQITKRKASQFAAIAAAPLGAVDGAALEHLFSGSISALAKHSLGGRVVGGAVGGAAFEGAQETAENIAGAAGMNYGAGTNESTTKGSLNNFALGALGGGPMGAIGGAFGEQNTQGDGSAEGQDAASAMGLPGPDAGVASANNVPPALAGPIGRVSQLAPDMTPQPEQAPPEPFFPDQKPGASVKLYDPESEVTHDAVFLGEGPDGVSVRIDGQEIVLNPQEFDQSRNEAARLDAEAEAQAKAAGKKPKKPKPAAPVKDGLMLPAEPSPEAIAASEQGYAEDEAKFNAQIAADEALGVATNWGVADGDPVLAPPTPAPDALSQQAVKAAAPPKAEKQSTLTPEEALARAKMIEDNAKVTGWNTRLTKQHAAFMEMAKQPGGENVPVQPILADGAGSNEDASNAGSVDRGAGNGSQSIDQKPSDNAPKTRTPDVSGVQDGVAGAAATGKPADPLIKALPQEDAHKPLRDHADANLVVDDTLPGRQKQGIPLASVKVGKAPDGSFMVRSDASTATSGFSKPMDGSFTTADEALHYGAAAIRKHADAVLRPGALESGHNEQDQADARKILKWLGERGKPVAAPRAPVAPMEADPAKRIQPDLLGGQPVTESDMAKKERTRREWGKFLGIAEHGKSSEDMELDGRTAILRPGKVIIRATTTGKSDQDRTIDTAGMDRDEISHAVRGALRELDRIAPLPKPVAAEPAPAPAKAAGGFTTAKGSTYEVHADGTTSRNKAARDDVGHEGDSGPKRRSAKTVYVDVNAAALSAAGMQGLDKRGARVALRNGKATLLWWNEKGNAWGAAESGRDIPVHNEPAVGRYPLELWKPETDVPGYEAYSNMHAGNKITEMRDAAPAPAPVKVAAPKPKQTQIGTNGNGMPLYEDADGVRSYVESGVRVSEPVRIVPGQGHYVVKENRGGEYLTEAERAPVAPTAAEVNAIAAEANPNPTDGQKEAGNYKKGHLAWNGLDLAIETAKGELRSGKDSDGETWSVKMPAHYGDIKGTVGADGDPVDFYMGPNPESNNVFVIDQVDTATGAFDEHKIMLGFPDVNAALASYVAGFSDNKGPDRLGAITRMEAGALIYNLKNSNWDAPWSRDLIEKLRAKEKDGATKAEAAKPAAEPKAKEPSAPAKPAGLKGLTEAENAKLAALQARFKDKLKNQINSGLDPEMVAIAVEMGALYVKSGIRRFRALVESMMKDMGLTLEQAQPYARNAYNHLRGDMDLNGEDISDMDTDAEVIAEVRKMRAAEAKAPKEATPSPEAAESAKVVQTPTKGTQDDFATDAGVSGASPGKSESAERAGSESGRSGGEGRSSADTGKSGPGWSAPERPQRRDNAEGADFLGRSGGIDRAVEPAKPQNHVIEPGGLEVKAGEKTRAKNSVEAIRVLRKLEQEGRPATAEERQKLALYGGAGTLAAALPRSDGTIRFADLASDLDELLDADERRTLSRTSQYAFYTSETTLRSMWTLAQRLGFKGGRIYEPGMGVGGFAGTMPDGLRGYGKYTGLELDHVTAKIAAALYPEHAIKQGDFIKEKLPNDFYDLVIGNPPFAGIKIQADPDYPQGFMLHDYFFAKSLDAVRPGGVLMFVTSAGTMNKMDSGARDYLADRADLLGAIRLPNTAFKENGTEVTTDIVVMRKRLPGEKEANPGWRNSDVIEVPDMDGGTGRASVNRYFIDHPEMILGEQGLFDTLAASDRIGVRPLPGSDFKADLLGAVGKFAQGAMSEATPAQTLDARDGSAPETKTGGYYLKDGDLWQFDGRTGQKVLPRSKENGSGPSKADHELIRELVPLKLALRDIYAADVNGAENASSLREALNKTYDAFVAKRGPVNLEVRSIRRPTVVEQETARIAAYEEARSNDEEFDIGSFDPSPMLSAGASMSDIARARKAAREMEGYREGDFDVEAMPDKIVVKRPNIEPFEDDPESFRLRAIEQYDSETDTAKKTRVFTESAVTLSSQPKISSPEDALLYLLADTGKVDLDRIASLSGSTPDAVRNDLGDKIFKDPTTGAWETRSKYLSGNVRKKLREALQSSKGDPAFDINVRALEEVQPDPVVASEIRVPIGAHWFPHALYSDWAKSIGMRLTAKHQNSLGLWVVDGSNTDAKSQNEFGTGDLPFADLMRRIMNNKSLKISRTSKNADGSTTTFVDDEATQAATDKATELREKFAEWFWSDEARSREMEGLYNEVFNAEVAPKYDGAYLTTPGIHSDWSWRPHQTAVVARILQSGSTYMAHTVGAGKTSAMIGAVMEARRLGVWKKPMVSVPNHMLVQFATEFYQQYPLANILVADEKRFHTSTRKQFIADVALGDWDAIIITHSAFGKIPASERAKREAVKDMLSDIEAVLSDTGSKDRGDRGDTMSTERSILGALQSIAATLGVKMDDKKEKGVSTRKKIERLLEAAEQRMARQVSDVGKDQVFDFDELGVDALLLDEAHLFRKLSFATGLGNIKGVDPAGSMASMDLYVKTRALEKLNPGRSLVLASGTPITNTMAEAYTISRYLQPQALADRGMSAFDAWAGTFGQVDSALEQTPDGGYKEVSRFAKFVNTPELSLMMRQVMDVVSGADLEKYVTRPKLKGGKRNLVVVEASPEVKAYQGELGHRMRMIENRKGPVSKGDDILLSVINDGRLSAIDMRLVDPSSSGHGSKLERMINNVFRVWKAGENAPLHGVKAGGGYTVDPIIHGPTAQIVFSTLGINGSKRNEQFKVHRFIKSELIRMGVPAAQIVMSEDLKTHAQKQNAFGDINEGKKRVLIGSKSLFTGVNAQRRLAAIHNLDPLWFPADDEQRNGRGIRQGNMNPEIEIFDYSTKGTYDATMWQMMGRKASFIEGFFRGDPGMREMEDLGEASVYEQAKAMSTADPRILELTDMKAERDKLLRRKGAIDTQRDRLGYEINRQDFWKDDAQKDIAIWNAVLPSVKDLSGDKFDISLNGQSFTKRTEAGNSLIEFAAESVANAETATGAKKIGEISGFPISMRISLADQSAAFSVELAKDHVVDVGFSDDPVGMMRRLESAVSSVRDRLDRAEASLKLAERKQKDAQQSLGNINDFSEGPKLRELQGSISDLEATLKAENAPKPKEARIAPVPVAALRDVSAALAAEIKASGLEGKVSPALVRNLLGKAGVPIQGRQAGPKIEVAADSADPIGVLRHEIVHALRDANLWDAPYGLFTGAEWKSLVAAARSDTAVMQRVEAAYADQPASVQIEEAVAEMYREWAGARAAAGPVARTFNKVASFFRALASALRGQGFNDAAMVMERIAGGSVGGRGPDGGGRGKSSTNEMRNPLPAVQAKFKGLVGSTHWKDPSALVSNVITDAMVGGNGYNAMALVPGRALFAELGKYLPAAKAYLRQKEEMDSVRNDWHARADAVAQRWLAAMNKDPAANAKLTDLMHRSTLSGIDPSRDDNWKHAMDAGARREVSERGDEARDWAKATMSQIAAHEASYAALKADYDALPLEFRQLYRTVKNGYDAMDMAFEKAILQNIQNATKVGLKRAVRAHEKELERIRDEGMEGTERDEAIASADANLKAIKMRGGFSARARLAAMRKQFEANRLKGPYFPLARFGNYFVTVRDATGAVTSFSKFEKESQQQAHIRELKEEGETKIEFGTMDDAQKLRSQIDPGFVADIENMLAESGAGDDVMDAVWQRWLETLPDRSIRTSNIHRKGRAGFSKDAFRAFSKQMFHGGHQLTKLEHGLLMEEHLNDAAEQARKADDPNRSMQVVAEMKKRHDFTMNPTGNKFVAGMSNIAFIWYLGATPAAALANITQTTVVGVPLMAARFEKAGVKGVTQELGRAMKDFVAGRGAVSKRVGGVPVWSEQWTAEKSPNLSSDEKAALAEAVRRGTIDKTQSHDLASAAEHGAEYNATREKWMRRIGFFFHHAERFNREITFLANYRLAKAEGMDYAQALDAAADLTFKIHFDMQNNSRPRVMQNDIGKMLTCFRQFTVNMLWRLFRDTHQALNGKSKEDRREARLQLVGLSLSMMAHAGIRGVWGYGLLMMLLGMLAPGADDDDIKEWLQEALLMQGDSAGVAAWNFTMGAALNGVPGQVFGVDLTDRIGMPNLWFRDAPNDLEGSDLFTHYVMEVAGPAVGVGAGFFRGAQLAADGSWWRGAESAVPKVVRDGMKTARYIGEGVKNLNGDSLVDGLSPYQALVQAIGFTPAEIAERYDINSRLKDRERQVTDERGSIQKAAAAAILAGTAIPSDVLSQISDFNSRYPEYPITGATIQQSARGKMRALDRSEFGIVLNAKLNDRLRGERATPIGR